MQAMRSSNLSTNVSRLVFVLSLGMIDAMSQTKDIEYRTVREDDRPIHYLVFDGKQTCTLVFPTPHIGRGERFSFKYQVRHDTITFAGSINDSDSLKKRILDSHFVIKSKKELYDCVSGLPYIDKKLIDDDVTVVSIDGTIHRMKGKKWNLKRKLTGYPDGYTTAIVRGKPAYEKYGIDGMNLVVEIESKK